MQQSTMTRRNQVSIQIITISLLITTFSGCAVKEKSLDVADIDRERILTAAEIYLQEDPVTVTASQCDRSYGGIHDFYSEGDYWWPDPQVEEVIRNFPFPNPFSG
jgi:hypothetical protein